MSDQIGRVTVPSPVSSGTTFPLVSDYGYGMTQDWQIVEHRFGELATMAVQRFGLGSGARRFQFSKHSLSISDRASLLSFYNSVQGGFKYFTYPAPNTDRSTFTNTPVIFSSQPLSLRDLANRCEVGIEFIEYIDPASAPTLTVSSVCTRFPSTALAAALLSEVQEIVPLLHIRVSDPAVPDIYLSDRRLTLSGSGSVPTTMGWASSSQLYLPRILDIGEEGSDVLFSQDLRGSAESFQLKLGNADRVMSKLVKDTSLKYASIDFCIYHSQSQILLQLWKGMILNWTVDSSPTFSLHCSDDIYPLTRSYPVRAIERECYKDFNDGVKCPWASKGAGGNPSKCDYSLNGAEGCLSHGMGTYFGGHPAFPQSVVIKDNGTGTIGKIARSTITSTSIVSDSIWGQPLSEIWCNDDGDPKKAFYANCLVPVVRDESDFMDVLGIVGAGPLGGYEGMSVQTNADGYKFIVSPLADGFPPHGFKVDSQLRITGYQPTFGLREVFGTDPVTPGVSFTDAKDQFSLGQGTPQHWDVADPIFSNITGRSNRIFPYSAGTAFVEIRYSKAATSGGIVPSTAESHSLVVPLSKGLAGYTFDASGIRSDLTSGLTNPFWVAVNSWFRAQGIDGSNAATQLASIVLSSLTDGAGNGCAEISDLSVAPIVGDHSVLETQFRFQGLIGGEFKPFRDWLTEILNCALGNFTFEFGKLRLGIRENASASVSFTAGNTLYQSLSIQPAEVAFEKLRVDFANRDVQYQDDYAVYHDKDHSRYFGTLNAPLTSRMKSVGLSSLSQALRVCVTRVREETGGIYRADQINPYIEWDNNNIATWKSTILSLDAYVSQVAEITHPDLPTYPGAIGGSPLAANTWKYRITRMVLHKDWSVTFQGKSVTDSMYDLDVGPKPADINPAALPVLFYPEPLGEWHPYQTQADAADALFPSEYTFDLAQKYTELMDASYLAQAVATGKLAVNKFIVNCGAPDVKKGSVVQATTGGNLSGGKTYYVQVSATDSAGRYSPPSEVLILQIPAGTNTNKFTLTGIVWPNVDGLTGYVVFASDVEELICGQQTGALTGSSAIGYTPSSIVVTGPFSRSTYGVPNVALTKQRLKGRRLIHGGVLGASVTAIDSTSLTSTDIIDGTATDNWTGRAIAMIGRFSGDGIAPFASFNVTAFDPATGKLTVDRDPVAAGIQLGDVFVVCFLGADNSSTPYVISDAGLSNITNGHVGETVNDPNRIGNSALVIKGLGRGESGKIVSNTATSYTLDSKVIIDATSVWIVVTAAWEQQSELPLDNADPTKATEISMDINNYAGLPMLIGMSLVDENGGESADDNMPVRMLWVSGHPGSIGPPPATPGLVSFTPYLDEYGTISVNNVSVATPLSLTAIDWLLYFIDELTADVFVTTDVSANNTDDPLTIATTDNPSLSTDPSILDFVIGDYVVWNDAGSFEISKITAISGSAPSRTLTLSRATADRLGSSKAAHASNIQLFKLQTLRDLRLSQDGALPDRFKFSLPASCVAAITARAYVGTEFSATGLMNVATATIPGIRTFSGAVLTREKSGTLAASVGTNVFEDLHIPFSFPYRVAYCYVKTAPTGASLKVKVWISLDNGVTWIAVEELTIPAGSKQNWTTSEPQDRQEPYAGVWPFVVLPGGSRVNFSIEQVGSTIAGADLVVVVAV